MDASVAPPYTTSPLSVNSLPKLSALECTFTECTAALAPQQPLICLKTCFLRSDPDAKRIEMTNLFAEIQLSTAQLVTPLAGYSRFDICESFSVELLSIILAERLDRLSPFVFRFLTVTFGFDEEVMILWDAH
ncbi:uncharacterized protein ARMOST_14649 [Armillaria ostoyae]|uniref:Uncharacterized protein n=1 Tax=Armillaria ostoyae TaxID=47428 RepID=A0A284RR36_ARMOS|nr:uncharacterized protein ARMOST_14649 [Armillaria ostoyae]